MIEETASDEVVVSYPIFEAIFDAPSIRGRDAVLDFSAGFCSRWSDPAITVHETLQDGARVVLVWEFSAVPTVARDSADTDPAAQSWGGMSFFRFDSNGKVIEEVGEESTPGPVARLRN